MRWYPDTCACVIEYATDATGTPIAPIRTLQSCSAHSTLTQLQRHNTLWSENPRRQRVKARLMDQWPLLFTEVDVVTGEVRWKEGAVVLSWSGSGQTRILEVDVSGSGMTVVQRTIAQTWCDTNLGTGRVNIVG